MKSNLMKNKKEKKGAKYIEDAFPRAKGLGEKIPDVWRIRVSIPAPPACEASALPFELIPQHTSISDVSSTKLIAKLVKLQGP